MPPILFFDQDQIPDYRYVWNPWHMLPPATDRTGMLFRYPAAVQVCPDQMWGRNTYYRCELKEVIKIVIIMVGWRDGL